MPISANALFHFTNTRGNLISILENEFRPHYSLEDYSIILPTERQDINMRFAIPMVSFCDIPISHSKTHRTTYGQYGIGLSKEWGQKNGVSPVLYVYHGSKKRCKESTRSMKKISYSFSVHCLIFS